MDDLISRRALLAELQEEMEYESPMLTRVINDAMAVGLKIAIRRTKRAATVDAVEVVHGRWVHTTTNDDDWGGTYHEWTCSNCNWSTGHNPGGTNYCPNCGAKMDGERKIQDE